MRLSILLSLLSVVAAADPRSKEAWVGDLAKVDAAAGKLVTDSQKTNDPERRIYPLIYNLGKCVDTVRKAASFQLTALNPSAAHGSRVDGGSCRAMGEYFATHVVKSNLDAVNVFLDPGVACAPAYRARFRVTRAGVPVYLAQLESEWEEYTQAYVKNCKEEQGAGYYVIQEYQPLKVKLQEAHQAYYSIDKYCKERG